MLVLATESLTLSMLLFAVWLHDRTRRYYVNWSVGFAARGAGVTLIALRSTIPDVLSIGLGNTIAVCGIIFWIIGLCQFAKRKVPAWVALPAAISFVALMLPVIRNEPDFRSSLYGIAAVMAYLMLAGLTFTSGNALRSKYRYMLGITWLLMAANITAVTVYAFVEIPENLLKLSIGPISGAIGVFCFIAVILIGAKMIMDESELRLQYLVRSDPLTKVLNRRGVIDAFDTLRKSGSGAPPLLALLLFDLDDFKRINDTHGHETGDRVLVAFSQIAHEAAVRHGVFGRTGGEEFSAVIRVHDIGDATELAETIRRRVLEMPVSASSGFVTATVSIGVFAMEAGTADLDQLMREADRALYAAKSAGRNRTATISGGTVVTLTEGEPADAVAMGRGNLPSRPLLKAG